MADLHPVTAASIDANLNQRVDNPLCGCWRGASGMMHLCEFHQGMEEALDPGVLAEAGYRLVRTDDLRWMARWMSDMSVVPPGVKVRWWEHSPSVPPDVQALMESE